MKSKSRSPDGNDFCFSSLHYSTRQPGLHDDVKALKTLGYE